MLTSTAPQGRVAIYQSDQKGRCIYVNSVLCQLFEISEEQALNNGWLDKVHPQDRPRLMAARTHAMSGVPVFHVDYRLRLAERTIWVAAFSTALMEGALFKGRIGTVTDVTEAKRHFSKVS